MLCPQVLIRTVSQRTRGHGRSLTVCLTGLQLVPLNLPNLFLLLLRRPTSARRGPVCQSTGIGRQPLLPWRSFAGILGTVGLSEVWATVEAFRRNLVLWFIDHANIYWVSIMYRQLLGVGNTMWTDRSGPCLLGTKWYNVILFTSHLKYILKYTHF